MTAFNLTTNVEVPRGTPNQSPLTIDLTEIEKIEHRKAEISYATKETAPELMQTFNTAYCSVTRSMAQVSYEYTQAKKYADKRKGIVLLEVAPDILSAKKLKSSEDLRKAILDQDDEYLALMDKVHMLEAVYEFLRSKAKGFEMAYQSAKKIFDITNSGLGSTHNHLMMGVQITEEQSPSDELEYKIVGKPRY